MKYLKKLGTALIAILCVLLDTMIILAGGSVLAVFGLAVIVMMYVTMVYKVAKIKISTIH